MSKNVRQLSWSPTFRKRLNSDRRVGKLSVSVVELSWRLASLLEIAHEPFKVVQYNIFPPQIWLIIPPYSVFEKGSRRHEEADSPTPTGQKVHLLTLVATGFWAFKTCSDIGLARRVQICVSSGRYLARSPTPEHSTGTIVKQVLVRPLSLGLPKTKVLVVNSRHADARPDISYRA